MHERRRRCDVYGEVPCATRSSRPHVKSSAKKEQGERNPEVRSYVAFRGGAVRASAIQQRPRRFHVHAQVPIVAGCAWLNVKSPGKIKQA